MRQSLLVRIMAFALALLLLGCGTENSPVEPIPTSGPTTQPTHPTAEPTAEPTTEPTEPPDPYDLLTEKQKNAIAMYNYLAVVTQEINDNPNGRMFLEEVYSALMNNTNPEAVDERTQVFLADLLNVIDDYRFNDVKRERIQYIFDQNKAKILKEAIPDASVVISAAGAFVPGNPAAALNVADLANKTIGSYSSYQDGIDLLTQEYLRDGWELDDEQKSILHTSRTNLFQYLLDTVQNENIPGEMVLSEGTIKEFVEWINQTNVHQKIRYLESEEDKYKVFASYWHELVGCYYEVGDYEKCLAAMEQYERVCGDLFKQDGYLAQVLPIAIAAAHEVYETEAYIPIAERYLSLLKDNALNTDWSLRYFAAQMYIDLYNQTEDDGYLSEALEILIDNVNHLTRKQRQLNTDYISGVKTIEESENAGDTQLDLIGGFMDYLNSLRKVELPPIYEPLTVNCDLLFALAEKLDVSQAKKDEVENILRGGGEPLFLSEALEQKYSFGTGVLYFTAQFNKETMVLPVSCVSEKSVIRVSVTTDGTTTVHEDWVVQSVDRPSADFTSFVVTYASESIKEQQWNGDSIVTVEVVVDATDKNCIVELRFEVSNFVDMWLVPDIIEFAQISE